MDLTLCSGVVRSGSTWAFNVCRLLNQLKAEQLGRPHESHFRDTRSLELTLKQINQPDNQTIYTIKTHTITQNVIDFLINHNIKNVCTLRDPRDCVASEFLFHQESIEAAVTKVLNTIKFLAVYVQIGNVLFIRYENMIKDPKQYIKIIANYLDIVCDDKVINYIYEQTNIEKSKQISEQLTSQPKDTFRQEGNDYVDKKTYLHTGHVQGGQVGRWQTDLTTEQQAYVNAQLKPWLDLLGYCGFVI